MGQPLKFEDVKVGDKIVSTESGFGSEKYNIGTVDKVTATRFTVAFGGYAITFTKDGSRYPRPTGYSRAYTRIEKATPELLAEAKRNKDFTNAQYGLRDLGEKAYKLKIYKADDEQLTRFKELVNELKTLTAQMVEEK